MKHQKHSPVYPWSFLLLIELREPIHVRSVTMVVDSAQQERSNWINQDPCMWRKRRYSTTSKLALVIKPHTVASFFPLYWKKQKKNTGPIWLRNYLNKICEIQKYQFIYLYWFIRFFFNLILWQNENIHLRI